MYVFELVQPGTWLDGISDDDERRETDSLLRLLTSCLDDAAIALAMFEAAAQSTHQSSADHRGKWDRQADRERKARERLAASNVAEPATAGGPAIFGDLWEQARIMAKREAWSEGEVPDSYTHRIIFVHAKSFLYALDTLQKSISLLARLPSAPADLGNALQAFDAAFPNLKHVRDSAHHVEDRVRGKQREKPISLQPVVNPLVHAPNGGVLIIDSLMNNRYGSTLAGGTYGEVEVSAGSAAQAQGIVQQVLNAYQWHGPINHSPR